MRVAHNSLPLANPWPSNSRSNWNLEMLIFEEGGKLEKPEKTLGIEPGTHWWEATLSPLRHPCSPKVNVRFRLHSFGVIQIWISDPRCLDHGTSTEPANRLRLWIHQFLLCTMIQTDLGSLILIRITPKERSLRVDQKKIKKNQTAFKNFK